MPNKGWEGFKTDRQPLKQYPVVGACGLSCGLCPRYHTAGTSRCPGCCGSDFWQKHPSCGFITCCVRQKKLETCAQCADWKRCDRVAKVLDGSKYRDSFISYRPLAASYTFINEHGIEEFVRQESVKLEFLRYLIANYDEGRSKSFYCTSCQLLPLGRLRTTLAKVEKAIAGATSVKDKARIVRAAINNLAAALQIDLNLRK